MNGRSQSPLGQADPGELCSGLQVHRDPPRLTGVQSWLALHLRLLHAAFLSTSPPRSAVQPDGLCGVLVHEGESKSCKASDVRPGGHAAAPQCLLLVRPGHRSARVTGRGRGRRLSKGVAGGHLWKHFRSKLETGLEGSFSARGPSSTGPKHFPGDRRGLQLLTSRVALAHQVMLLGLISVSCEI